VHLQREVHFFLHVRRNERRDPGNELPVVNGVVACLVEHGEKPVEHLGEEEKEEELEAENGGRAVGEKWAIVKADRQGERA
jgi:hypothetical protein